MKKLFLIDSNFKRAAVAAAVAASLLTLPACAPVSPDIDNRFGASLGTLKTQQIINPNAASNSKAATLDGSTALEASARYKESYKKPAPPANAFTIGIGK